ncbi:endonuclease III [Gottschalkiaceae bacterium SANA]|nr:endonuclease III [Gottschalkiaceae bacterium SANA]
MRKRLTKKEKESVLEILETLYPNPKTELNWNSEYELLVAVMLSAQTTDVAVNKVTAELFPIANTPEMMVGLSTAEIESKLRRIGLYHNKTKNLLAMSQLLVDRHNSQVPATREALEALPGVGRKTANVVLSNAFEIPAIAVDTHVFRVSNRIGLAQATNVRKTEEDLMKVIPKKDWKDAHHWIILHGRRVCMARNPNCESCPLAKEKLCLAKLNDFK